MLGPGPRLMRKKNLPGRGLTKVEKHWSRSCKRWSDFVMLGRDYTTQNEVAKKEEEKEKIVIISERPMKSNVVNTL